jgi:hypothetical protein
MTANIGLKGSFLRSKKFGRETNFAWQNSEAVVSNPLSPVLFVSHTQVWETCVRRVFFQVSASSLCEAPSMINFLLKILHL